MTTRTLPASQVTTLHRLITGGTGNPDPGGKREALPITEHNWNGATGIVTIRARNPDGRFLIHTCHATDRIRVLATPTR